MFGWFKKPGADDVGLGKMTRELERMIQEGRHMFDAAVNALLAGTDPQAIREDLFQTDQRINRLEQQIRRQIVVHGSVHGTNDFPELLVLMSVTKDAERIGDYAKNLFGVAVERPIPSTSTYHPELMAVKESISRLLADAPEVYDAQQKPAAQAFVERAQKVMARCDAAVARILRSETGSGVDTAAALSFRHMKRTAGHIQNIVTAVIMPVHKLDFFDEPEGPPRDDE